MNITVKNLNTTKLLVPTLLSNFQYRNIVWFEDVPLAPPDPVFGVLDQYMHDQSKEKVNLTIGAYRDDDGKPFVLKSVRKAEDIIRGKNLDKEYSGILGSAKFCKLSFEFAMGEDNEYSKSGRVATVQTISGTGAVTVAAMFLAKFYPSKRVAYVSKPTWSNHITIFEQAGLGVETYRYYDSKKVALDFDGMMEDLTKNVPEKAIILFHVSAHNPTGFDPTPEQWDKIAKVCKEKSFYLICDCAYQGFASGNPDNDVYSIRTLAKAGINMAICQSYSKNMGLYGERIGCLSIITDCPAEAAVVTSQLKTLVRSSYSTPPINGARIAEEILSNKDLRAVWLEEVKQMAQRMRTARQNLRDGIIKEGSKRNWDHITSQIGMFSFTGLSKKAVHKLKKDYHIYLLDSGRISICGINSKNVAYVGKAFHKVTI